jgi:outer membrane protein OmpA-like peptidoglycan-associated protein
LGQALTSKELEKDQFEICGHTDSTGSEEYNLRLSRKRAHAVNDYLEHTYGYSCALIKGYGEKQPVASNDTPEGRAKNRRVVINRLD